VDTENSVIIRPKDELNIREQVRRKTLWADREGVRIAVTNKRNETMLQYSLEEEPEIREIPVSIDESARGVLDRLTCRGN
jgi:hypothetical protein